MFVSVPEWYDRLEEASGPAITSFEHLWHENHINVFSEKSLKNLFKKVGFEIIKEDHFVYGQTYLIKKCEPKPLVVEDYDNYQDIIAKTKLSNDAIKLYLDGKNKEAVELYPKFPDAWINLIMNTYGKDTDRQEDTWMNAFKALPHNKKLLTIYAGVYLFQREKYKEAIEILEPICKVAIDEEKTMVLGQCYSMLGDHKKAMISYYKASDMNPLKWQQAMDFMGKEASLIPTWDEVELQKVAEKAVEDAKNKLKLVDPLLKDIGNSPISTPIPATTI
jgi:tetratricopeptide (TPR) repeat protein